MSDATFSSGAVPGQDSGGERSAPQGVHARAEPEASEQIGGVSRAEIAERARAMRWVPLAIPLVGATVLACMALVLSET